jgi:hypothetical protein
MAGMGEWQSSGTMQAIPAASRPAASDEALPDSSTVAGRVIDWNARHPYALLAVSLFLAVVVRTLLVIFTHAMIDGDEALVGIQAERILRGSRPVYFYGQPYMGSLEAYLAAAIFFFTGPSSWALRVVPTLLALPLVYLTWRLARALLPTGSRATPLLAGLAALFAAVPPLYDAVAEMRTWGGQIEIYIVTLALLLATVELARRLREGAGAFELARRWAVLGFLAGLGIWINPLVSYALAACAVWLLPPLVQRVRACPPEVISLVAFVPGLALGGLPAWIYAAQHHAENLLVFVQQPSVSPAVSGAARHGRLFLGAAITARYLSCDAPQVLDGSVPGGSPGTLALHLLLLLPPLAATGAALWLLLRRGEALLRLGMPLLYAGVVTAVFCLGTSAWAATKACAMDWAGRYAVPLVLVEPFVLLALFAVPRVWNALRRQPAPSIVSQRHWWSVALAVLVIAGTLQFGSYWLAAPTSLFQSPYYRNIALDNRQLLDYLSAHDIRAAWANHWLGNIVTFETNGRTVTADYYDQVYLNGIHRPPGALESVMAANRPSFILISTNPHPLLARELARQGITYTMAILPQAGVTVITPSRTVDPATVISGLGTDYIP